jgi:hypothetical protein
MSTPDAAHFPSVMAPAFAVNVAFSERASSFDLESGVVRLASSHVQLPVRIFPTQQDL